MGVRGVVLIVWEQVARLPEAARCANHFILLLQGRSCQGMGRALVLRQGAFAWKQNASPSDSARHHEHAGLSIAQF